MELREIVRGWLIDERVGFIGSTELKARADRTISDTDDPPDFLIAVSLGEPLHFVDRLDLLKHRLTSEDLGGLASRLLEALDAGRVDVEEIAAISARIAFPTHDSEMVDPWTWFCWITDEADLIDQGIRDGANFKDGVIEALNKIAEYAPT